MATRVWQGNAIAVAQVSTITVTGTWATSDTATLTCGSQSVTFTVAATQTIAAVVAGLVAAWNAVTAKEMAEVTAADNSPDITLTSDTAGVSFVVTTSESTAGDGALGDQTDTTANSGPNCFNTAANWSGGAVPVAADTIIFENGSVDCLYELSQSGATYAALIVHSTYTGKIGLPRNNANGYVEYRTDYLTIDVSSVYIGLGAGAGSGRIKLDTGTVQTDINVWLTAAAIETGIPAFLFKGSHAASTMTVNKGSVGLAFFGGETAQLTTLAIGYVDTQATDADVQCGVGLTLGTLNMGGGTVAINNTVTTAINQRAGTLEVNRTAATDTLQLDGGTCYWQSSGAITTKLFVNDGATIDYSRDNRARAIAACEVHSGGTIIDPEATGGWQAGSGIDVMETDLEGVTLRMRKGQTWTPSAT